MAKLTEDALEQRVKEILAEHIGRDSIEQIEETTRLFEDLGMDSLDRVEIVLLLEEEFLGSSAIPDNEVEDMRTVADVVAAVRGANG